MKKITILFITLIASLAMLTIFNPSDNIKVLLNNPKIELDKDNEYEIEIGSDIPNILAKAYDTLGNELDVSTSNNININKIGSYKLVFKTTDIAGNVSTITKQFKVDDKTKPVFINVNNNTNYQKNGYATFNILETGSGIKKLEYSYDNVTYYETNNYSSFNYDKSYSGNVYLKCTDVKGNVSDILTLTFNIDKTSPVISNVKEFNSYRDKIVLTDNVNLKYVKVGNKYISLYSNYYELNLTENNGFKNGYNNVTLVDAAGNVNYKQVYIDNINPTFKNIENGKTYNKIAPQVEDYNYAYMTLNGTLYDGHEISEDGFYTLTVYDKANNVSSISFYIDNTAPQINVESISLDNVTTITLHSNEKINDIEGFTKLDDFTYIKDYSENEVVSFDVYDFNNNKTTIEFEVVINKIDTKVDITTDTKIPNITLTEEVSIN